MAADTVIEFPPFRLDLLAGRLFRGDEVVALRPKTFATLAALARRPGERVTKDEAPPCDRARTVALSARTQACYRDTVRLVGTSLR